MLGLLLLLFPLMFMLCFIVKILQSMHFTSYSNKCLGSEMPAASLAVLVPITHSTIFV